MQKAKFVFTLSLLFVANLSLFAQNIEFTKSNFISRTDEFEQIVEDLDTGNVLFANGNAYCKYNLEYQYCNKGYKFYKEALPYLSKAQLFNPNNAELNFQIGICYFYSPFKYKALSFFEKAYTLQSTINPLCSYYLATCYHLNKQWDQAISLYQQTIEQLKTLKDIKHISQNEL